MAPHTEVGDKAAALIAQFDTRNKVSDKTIGVILPLSGKQAGIGAKALHGIQLGLGVYGSRTLFGFPPCGSR